MRARAAVLALLASGCARLADDVFYQCELDGGCFQADHVCGSDGYCRPTGAGGGNATGGGSVGGGSNGGGSNGGGSNGGGTAGGGTAIGGGEATGGGAGGGDAGCMPQGCPGTSIFACGLLDDGCGHTLDCALLADGGHHTCAALTFCGAGTDPNLCAAPVSCVNGWCWENPLPQGNSLNAVWATGVDTWAVGNLGTVLRYNGQYWKLAPSPTRSNLRAVQGRAPNDIWAAGDDGVILHYDGTAWAVDHLELGAAFRAVAVAPTGEVFAGGADGVVLARLDGGWQALPKPLDEVNALWAFGANALYAGGASATAAKAAFWNGGWSAILAPGISEVHALLGTPDGGLFAGADPCIVAQLQGTSLNPVPGSGVCDGGILALAGTADNLFAAGAGFAMQYDGGFNDIVHSDAGTWRGAFADSPGTVIFVGDDGLLGRARADLFMAFDSSGTRDDVTSAFIADSGEVLAGADEGQVLKRSIVNRAGTWRSLNATVAFDRVTGLWGSSSTDLWAVTDTGIIAHTTSVGFSINPIPDQQFFALTHHLSALQFGGTDAGEFTIGDGQFPVDAVLSRLPASVQMRGSTLRGLFSDGINLYGVTGDGDLISSTDGNNWNGDIPLSDNLTAVHGAPNYLIAVGADGGAWTGTSNITMSFAPTGTHANFNGVFASAAGAGWLVGDQGAALQFSGATFTAVPIPTAADLLGVTGAPDAGLIVVGRHGTVLSRP